MKLSILHMIFSYAFSQKIILHVLFFPTTLISDLTEPIDNKLALV